MVHGLATFASALKDGEELSLNPRAYVYAVKLCIPLGLAAANRGDDPSCYSAGFWQRIGCAKMSATSKVAIPLSRSTVTTISAVDSGAVENGSVSAVKV